MSNIAIENGPVEIVDLPINSMVDRSHQLCKRLPEGIIQMWIIIQVRCKKKTQPLQSPLFPLSDNISLKKKKNKRLIPLLRSIKPLLTTLHH